MCQDGTTPVADECSGRDRNKMQVAAFTARLCAVLANAKSVAPVEVLTSREGNASGGDTNVAPV